MTLRSKLIAIALAEIVLTIAVVGALAFRESKHELENLSRELLRAKTEYAYALCERYDQEYGQPNDEIKQALAAMRISADGYISVLDNSPEGKGRLVVHPAEIGKNLYNDEFPHVKKIYDQIDAMGEQPGYGGFTEYVQRTEARGRAGERKIGYYLYYKPWQWILLATSYESDIFESSATVKEHTTLIVILSSIIAALIIGFSIRKMFSPLRQLIQTTKDVAAGNLDASIVINSKDEIGELGRSFNTMLRSIKQNTRIWQELEIARIMQTRMLPAASPPIPGIELVARSLPATEVGGDFYDFLPACDGRYGLIVGDISGKGLSGAMVMSAAISSIRFAAEGLCNTAEILSRANQRLNHDLQSNMFVAACLAMLDPERLHLSYTNAGQPLPLLCRDGRVEFVPQDQVGDRFPLGILPAVAYRELDLKLQPGDLLVFYTDGLVDMMNDHGEPYGFDRLRGAVERHLNDSPADIISNVFADAENFGGNGNPQDDVTMLLVKVSG
jgi:serine phosphatase RsbU (regulator of sigma subunit)